MAAKRTYSVRMEDAQRQQLEMRAAAIGLPTGHLIRLAVAEYLRQQEEKDYLEGVEARIATSINRLARQVEKDRAEQQLMMGVLDYLREWLSFTLPSPPDKHAANELMRERNKNFLTRLPLQFVSGSRAKVTAYMDGKATEVEVCPKCFIGILRPKDGKAGKHWYCTNSDTVPQCNATFPDESGHPKLSSTEFKGS